MTLLISPSFPPMKASCLLKIPSDAEWQYEPKYNPPGESLNRYFRVVVPLQQLVADRDVIDCEMVICSRRNLSFDGLLQRIDPAAFGNSL